MPSLVEKVFDFIDWIHFRISGKRMAPGAGTAVHHLVILGDFRELFHMFKPHLHILPSR